MESNSALLEDFKELKEKLFPESNKKGPEIQVLDSEDESKFNEENSLTEMEKKALLVKDGKRKSAKRGDDFFGDEEHWD
jgi:hypothetical protein